MSTQLIVIGVIVVAAIMAARQARAWWKYRGLRVVDCPENHRATGVVVDARHASATSLLGAPELRLSSCSRWPEREGCGQACLNQVAAAPEDCLVRNVLAGWYEGKVCGYCGRPFHEVDWNAYKPALRRSDGVSVDWDQVPPEKLQDTLASAQPVCLACHAANSLVREHPDLVTDRSSKSSVG